MQVLAVLFLNRTVLYFLNTKPKTEPRGEISLRIAYQGEPFTPQPVNGTSMVSKRACFEIFILLALNIKIGNLFASVSA